MKLFLVRFASTRGDRVVPSKSTNATRPAVRNRNDGLRELGAFTSLNTEGTERLCGLRVKALRGTEDTETPLRAAPMHRPFLYSGALRVLVLVLGMVATVRAQAAPPQTPKLTLKDAEALALRNHPLLQAATFEAEAANQVTREEKSAYYPTAIGSLTGAGAIPDSRIAAGFLNNPTIYNRYSNGLEVNQLITDFGRTSNLVASARLGAKAASESAQQTAQDVLLAVNRAYFGVLRAEAVLKVAEETVKARQILADQITTLEKNKLRSLVDVSFAEVDLAQAQLLLVQAQNNEKASYAELATALGLANPQPFDLAEEPMPPAPLADPTDLIVQALQDRPDLSSARFSHEAALRYARAERDLWMPTISATGAAGLTPAYQVPLSDRYAAAGINVNIPIFNGFLFSARHQEANLRAKAADQSHARPCRPHLARRANRLARRRYRLSASRRHRPVAEGGHLGARPRAGPLQTWAQLDRRTLPSATESDPGPNRRHQREVRFPDSVRGSQLSDRAITLVAYALTNFKAAEFKQ